MNIDLGISPCPNDTFIFHALLHGLIPLPENLAIHPKLADVQRLNEWAYEGALPATKLSLGVIPYISDNYALLSSGAALGWGCGPLVVAKNRPVDLKTAKVAIPGKFTTAALLLDLTGNFEGERVDMLFNEIMPAVAGGQCELGVIIHEGRFTYGDYGLHKVMDLGEWWEENWHLPLPLGAIAVRRDLQKDIMETLQNAIAASLEYGWANPDASKEFICCNAQELNEQVTREHIATFVTSYSRDLGEKGRGAIDVLVNAARKRMGLPKIHDLFAF